MKKLTIYIASSWKNQHAVEMLTALLREEGHTVISWVENNYGETHNHVTKEFDFETWVQSPESDQSFAFDTNGAHTCQLFIYVGPAGQDAAAECGICYSRNMAGFNIPMYALHAKSEGFGLMRKMFNKWFDRYTDLLEAVNDYQSVIQEEKKTILMIGDVSGSLGQLEAEYNFWEKLLETRGYEVINPLNEIRYNNIHSESLFHMLRRANRLFVFNNWKESELAKLVYEAAADLSYIIIHETPPKLDTHDK